MIAPIEKTPHDRATIHQHATVRQQAVGTEKGGLSPAIKTAAVLKHWVAEHPTAAVAACAMLGLVVGYLVKRR